MYFPRTRSLIFNLFVRACIVAKANNLPAPGIGTIYYKHSSDNEQASTLFIDKEHRRRRAKATTAMTRQAQSKGVQPNLWHLLQLLAPGEDRHFERPRAGARSPLLLQTKVEQVKDRIPALPLLLARTCA